MSEVCVRGGKFGRALRLRVAEARSSPVTSSYDFMPSTPGAGARPHSFGRAKQQGKEINMNYLKFCSLQWCCCCSARVRPRPSSASPSDQPQGGSRRGPDRSRGGASSWCAGRQRALLGTTLLEVSSLPVKFTLALELSTRITNEIGDTRRVQMRTMSNRAGDADFDNLHRWRNRCGGSGKSSRPWY